MANQTFSARDRRRFAEIKEELHLLLPDTRPRSEAVHRCALLFAEVKGKGYQQIDGHELVEKWMWKTFKVGDRQARKWFDAATLPAAEVRGKHQGIEVMGGQIALEPDPAVRAAIELLAEVRVPPCHPLREPMHQWARALRAPGLSGRLLALHCLVAARLPGCAVALGALAETPLPKGLRELVISYRELLGAAPG